MSKIIKLKNCPFCGNEVSIEVFPDYYRPYFLWAGHCSKCGARSSLEATPEKAAHKWNMRSCELANEYLNNRPISIGETVYCSDSPTGFWHLFTICKKDTPIKGKIISINMGANGLTFKVKFENGRTMKFDSADIEDSVFFDECDAQKVLKNDK